MATTAMIGTKGLIALRQHGKIFRRRCGEVRTTNFFVRKARAPQEAKNPEIVKRMKIRA
jgi:hypothetical protein